MKTFQLIQDRSFQIPMTASWPSIGYLLFIIKKAYAEFEEHAGKIAAPWEEKTALIEAAINQQTDVFGVADLQNRCPGVGVDLIRKVLKRLKGTSVECLGRGQPARWEKMNLGVA